MFRVFCLFVSFFLCEIIPSSSLVGFFDVFPPPFTYKVPKAREKNRAFEIVHIPSSSSRHHGANVAKGTRHPDDVGGWVPLGDQERQLSNGKIRCVCVFFCCCCLFRSRAMMMMMMMMMCLLDREKPFTNVENGERKKSLWMRKGGREGSKRDSRAEMCSTRTFARINRRLCSFFLSHHVQSTSAETTAFTSSTSGRRGTSS